MALVRLAAAKTIPGPGRVLPLSRERCRELLAGSVAGHLALSLGALPLVVPVTCKLEGEDLLVRASRGWSERANFKPGVVAFQTASTSFDRSSRWEVVVQGPADVLGPQSGEAPPSLPLVPDIMTKVLRVKMAILTGWNYGASEPLGTEPPR